MQHDANYLTSIHVGAYLLIILETPNYVGVGLGDGLRGDGQLSLGVSRPDALVIPVHLA